MLEVVTVLMPPLKRPESIQVLLRLLYVSVIAVLTEELAPVVLQRLKRVRECVISS